MTDWLSLAQAEIYRTYGDWVKFGRKTLHKYGVNPAVQGDEVTVNYFGNETFLTDNLIDSISSTDAGDTDVPIYLEGMTRVGNEFTFVSQIVNTDASNGQTRVALTTPLCDCTRMRGLADGEVYVYENTTLSGGAPVDTTKIHNQLVSGDHTSLKAGTAIASNNYYLITNVWASIGKASGSNVVDMRLKLAQLGSTYLGDEFYTQMPWSTAVGQDPRAPVDAPYIIVPPNSRILMTASASGGTINVKAGFGGIFGDIAQR